MDSVIDGSTVYRIGDPSIGVYRERKQMQHVELHHNVVLTGIRAFEMAQWVKVLIVPALGSLRQKDPVLQASQ